MSRARLKGLLLLAATFFTACAAPTAADPAEAAYAYYAARYDRNADGTIAPHEYDRGAEAFKNLDRDGDGSITRADFDAQVAPPLELGAPYLFVRAFGAEDADSVGPEELDAAFPNVDADGDGALTFDELAKVGGPGAFPVLAAASDADGDGRLTLAELRSFVARRDRDGDGRVSRRERFTAGKEPRVGAFEPSDREPAPPFRLKRREGPGEVALADYRGRPVALVFGSYT